MPGAAALLREASSTGTSARSKRQTSKSTCNQAKSLHSILTTLFFCSKASKKMSSCVPTESLDYEWIHLIMQDRIPLEYFFHEFCGKLNSTKLGENVRTFHELCGNLHSSEFMENMFPSKFGEWIHLLLQNQIRKSIFPLLWKIEFQTLFHRICGNIFFSGIWPSKSRWIHSVSS